MSIEIVAAALLAQSSLASAGAAPAAQGEWVYFASDEVRDIFIDAASVRADGAIVRFRMRQTPRRLEGALFHSALIQLQMDCRAQTVAAESATTFDAAGATLTSQIVPPERLDKDPIYAGSDDARLYTRLCPASLRRPLPDRPPPPPAPIIQISPPMLVPPPVAPPPPPPPPANYPAERARPLVPMATLFTADDYPAAALRAEEQGTVLYRLTVDRDGRVSGCVVLGSSGSASLDSVTCRLVTARARFRPARTAKGKRTSDVVVGRLTWRIPPDEPEPPATPPVPQ